MEIKCLIVDDEPLAQDILERYILKTPGLQLTGKCFNVAEAKTKMEAEKADLVFMDIRMPLINGMSFVKSLKNPPAVIFTTAYSEYAADSYTINAVDYLLKPVTYERFCKGVEKYIKQRRTSADEDYIYLKVKGSQVKVLLEEILFAEAMRDYIKVITGSDTFIIHLTMKSLLSQLPTDSFLRIHRSFIINRKKVNSLNKKAIQIGSYSIPVGEKYRHVQKKIF